MSCYVPLWCKSNFSFLEGASHPDELVEEAQRLGLSSVLTDRDGVYGTVRGHVKAQELGIHLIIGSQVSVDDGSTIILLAQGRDGYANLCRLLTAGRLRSEKGDARPPATDQRDRWLLGYNINSPRPSTTSRFVASVRLRAFSVPRRITSST